MSLVRNPPVIFNPTVKKRWNRPFSALTRCFFVREIGTVAFKTVLDRTFCSGTCETLHHTSYLRSSSFFSQSSDSNSSHQSKENDFDHNIILGFKLLLSTHAHFNPTQHTFLGLKIIIETNHKKIVGELEDAAVTTHGKDLMAYELEAKEAIELLLDYEEYWTHSSSITFTEASRLVETNLTSDIHSRESSENNESDIDYAEVMLFVIVDGEIDDKGIFDCKQLKMFLKQSMEKIIKVHVTCSSTRKQEEHPLNSHLIIRY